MTTLETTDPVIVDPVHAGPETPRNQAVPRAHAAVTVMPGHGGRVVEGSPRRWRPVAGGSAVWDG